MVFGKIVGQVSRPGSPIHVELFLIDPVLDPVEAHVHGLGALLLQLSVGKASGGGVINLYWGGWLGMAHLF